MHAEFLLAGCLLACYLPALQDAHTLAKKGLQLIVSHNLLPNAKSHLQTSLRPILSSLGACRSFDSC